MLNVKRQADELMREKMKSEEEINKLKVQIREKSSQEMHHKQLMEALNRHAPAQIETYS